MRRPRKAATAAAVAKGVEADNTKKIQQLPSALLHMHVGSGFVSKDAEKLGSAKVPVVSRPAVGFEYREESGNFFQGLRQRRQLASSAAAKKTSNGKQTDPRHRMYATTQVEARHGQPSISDARIGMERPNRKFGGQFTQMLLPATASKLQRTCEVRLPNVLGRLVLTADCSKVTELGLIDPFDVRCLTASRNTRKLIESSPPCQHQENDKNVRSVNADDGLNDFSTYISKYEIDGVTGTSAQWSSLLWPDIDLDAIDESLQAFQAMHVSTDSMDSMPEWSSELTPGAGYIPWDAFEPSQMSTMAAEDSLMTLSAMGDESTWHQVSSRVADATSDFLNSLKCTAGHNIAGHPGTRRPRPVSMCGAQPRGLPVDVKNVGVPLPSTAPPKSPWKRLGSVAEAAGDKSLCQQSPLHVHSIEHFLAGGADDGAVDSHPES